MDKFLGIVELVLRLIEVSDVRTIWTLEKVPVRLQPYPIPPDVFQRKSADISYLGYAHVD